MSDAETDRASTSAPPASSAGFASATTSLAPLAVTGIPTPSPVPSPTVTLGVPSPTTVPAETSVPSTTSEAPVLPPSTTTVAPPVVPGEPALPAGVWDAAAAASSAGALTSRVTADGIHVGPGQTHESISDAVAAAAAGSTIIIHDNGDAYRESFSHDEGWIGKPLRFVAAPGERPVVSGADVVTDWTEDGGRWFHTYTGDRFEFALPADGDIIAQQLDGSSPNAGLLEQVFVDGQPLRQLDDVAALGPGSFVIDRAADRIYLADDPTGRTVEVSSRRRALMVAAGASGSSVEGLTITGFSPRHLDGKAMVVLDAATDVVLRDVVLTRSSAAGLVAVEADRLLIERVSMVANGARGMSGDRLDDLVIRRSRFEGNNTERFDATDCGGGTFCVLAGAKLTRSVGVEVSFSDFSNNRATGFWCDLDCRDLVFVANHAAGNYRHGAYYEVSEVAVIEANIFAHNGEAGVKASGSRDVRVAHNTFVGNGAHVNVGADYRPATIGFHVSPDTHMRNIDLVDNVFAETTERAVTIDPVNVDVSPPTWQRLGVVAGNLHLLVDADAGAEWRFRTDDGRFELDPAAVADPAGVEIGDPLQHFDGAGLHDLRLVGSAATIAADSLSPTAAAFFPSLGVIPPGAPLG